MAKLGPPLFLRLLAERPTDLRDHRRDGGRPEPFTVFESRCKLLLLLREAETKPERVALGISAVADLRF